MSSKIFVLFALITISFGSGACGGASSDQTPTNNQSANSGASTSSNVPATNGSDPAAANKKAAANEMPMNPPTNSSAPPTTTQNGAPNPTPFTVKPVGKSPDDSTISMALLDDLVRTRTFKSHPQLVKVEEIYLSKESNRKIIKVYLKNGTMKELPGSSFDDVMSEPAENILKAVAK